MVRPETLQDNLEKGRHLMHQRIKILMVSCAAIIPIIAASVITLAPKLVWNASKSAPIGLYLIVQRTPQLGEFALVTPSGPIAELIRTCLLYTSDAADE